MSIERDNLKVLSWVVGPFDTNIYVMACKNTKEAVIIDGGGNAAGLLSAIEENGWELKAIWQTHAHIDHVAGLSDLRAKTKAPIYLHPQDQPVYDQVEMQGRLFGIQINALPKVDRYIEEGERLKVGDLEAKILHLPGHSPGSVAFYFEEEALFFGGDVLFAGSIGRVDLPGGNAAVMRQTLLRVKELPDETVVLSGHGPKTTIGQEKRFNPFLR